MRGVFAVPMSQPELNDMEKIFKYTIDKGIKLLGFSREKPPKKHSPREEICTLTSIAVRACDKK